MDEQSFEIVFRGDILIGQPLAAVKVRMGQLFKLPPEQVDKLFTGKAVVLKRGLDQATAGKYKAAIAKAGAQVTIVATKGGDERAQRTRRLSLAPLGALLSPRSRGASANVKDIETGHLSLRAQEGNLVEGSELERREPAQVQLRDWQLAELGAILAAEATRAAMEQPIAEVNWELAELGADMAPASEAPPVPTVDADFDLAPVGADLETLRQDPPLAAPDTSHLALE